VDQHAQSVCNLKKRGHANVDDRDSDSDTEEEDFGNELGRIPSDSSSSSSSQSPSLSPSPSPSPLHRHMEMERTSTPGEYFTYSSVIVLIYTHYLVDTGESSHHPQSSTWRMGFLRRHHKTQGGTSSGHPPQDDLPDPQGRGKRQVQMTNKAK